MWCIHSWRPFKDSVIHSSVCQITILSLQPLHYSSLCWWVVSIFLSIYLSHHIYISSYLLHLHSPFYLVTSILLTLDVSSWFTGLSVPLEAIKTLIPIVKGETNREYSSSISSRMCLIDITQKHRECLIFNSSFNRSIHFHNSVETITLNVHCISN